MRAREKQAWIVFDLAFGDSGKGSVTDFLVRDCGAGLVVRFNGGAQAGHNVVTPDGRHHTFSQFGSGTFVPGVKTHLGPAFVLHPGAMLVEAEKLGSSSVRDAFERTTIDARALVVTPFQQAAGRLREILRGEARHGTCGVGVGEAVMDSLEDEADTIRAADLGDLALLRKRLESQRVRKSAEFGRSWPFGNDPRAALEISLLDDALSVERVLSQWAAVVNRLRVVDSAEARKIVAVHSTIVFEGAQGILLDQMWGFHPHTTWSDCTPASALAILKDCGFDGRVTRLGVIRAYSTRHGVGPFPTGGAGRTSAHTDRYNTSEGWQGSFRTGPLDLVLLRYAAGVSGGVDGVAVTCLDQFGEKADICLGYRFSGPPPEPALVETGAGGVVERLVPGEKGDLEHRERLGTLLRRVEPVLERIPRKELLARIAEAARAPVLIQSFGPKAAGKKRVGP